MPDLSIAHQASQTLLELFRVAQEVPSAEFIVVVSGSSSSQQHGSAGTAGNSTQPGMASSTRGVDAAKQEISQTLTYMKQLFGCQVRLISQTNWDPVHELDTGAVRAGG